jgi:hypothetical protein
MAETEVESILREIRERVAQQRAASPTAVVNGNGAGNAELASPANNESLAENLALINSHLTTTGRAWDRLPPLVSNRSGTAARLELWLKRQFKRATRWYSWEQVNFNAAVHQALRDLLPLLSALQNEIVRLRADLLASETRRKELEAQLQTQSDALKMEIAANHHIVELQKNQTEHKLVTLEDRLALLQEELRVCFKQTSLENSEAAVLEDRARRKTEALLEEIQRRVEALGK